MSFGAMFSSFDNLKFRVVDYSSFFTLFIVEGCAVTMDLSISRVTVTLGNGYHAIKAFEEIEFF